MKRIHQAIIVFAISALALLALRSHDLFVVDGSVRCLTVFASPAIHFHPNNHLLYLVDVFNWTRLVGALGFKLADPLSFVLAVDTMNGLAAAGCLAILYWIILRVTGSWRLAAATCVAYGLTTAFLQQATNPNEPMVGAFWSFLALTFAIVSLGNQRIWLLLASGLLFALAMATYRSMVFLAPAAAVLLIGSIDQSKPSRKSQLLRLVALGIAFITGCAMIFGWAYSRMGVPRAEWLAKFLHQEDAAAYFDPSLTQWLKLPLGWVRNCFPLLPSFNGMRGFLAGPKSVLIPVTVLVVVMWAGLIYCGYTLFRRRSSLNPLERTAIWASLAGLLFTAIPLLTWNPHYGKFWIEPLACFALLIAIAFRHFLEMSRRVLVVAQVAGFLFLVGAACNLPDAVRQHRHQNFEFDEARKVTQYVGDKDLVILDRGADSVSVIYGTLWGRDDRVFAFIDLAVLNRERVLQLMSDAIRKTQAAGGKVFFLGVVDVPKPTWDVFLDERCGVPYGSLDRYRSAILLKAQFKSRTGVASLWELPFPATQESNPQASGAHLLADWNTAQLAANLHSAPHQAWPLASTHGKQMSPRIEE